MKKIIQSLVITLFAINIMAETELNEGLKLHKESCVNCHISTHNKDFYTKSNRVVNELFALKSQVSRCATFLDTGWFPKEESNVVNYLNTEFYKFDSKK